MFFGKKAKIIPPEPPAQFKKEKLSPEALDHFVEKYLVYGNPNKEMSLPYVMQNGKQVYLHGYMRTHRKR